MSRRCTSRSAKPSAPSGSKQIMRYLGIDIGDKRTGLAVADDTTGIATPLDVIEARSEAHRLEELGRVIREQQPQALVVGLPLNMDGTEGAAAKKIRAAAQAMQDRFKLPVHFMDERLTSYAADQLMSQSGLTHRGKKLRRDALAAATLLQDFLRQKKQTDAKPEEPGA